MPRQEQEQLVVTIKRVKTSREATLLRYIKNHADNSTVEMLMLAAKPYWIVEALMDCGSEIAPEELRRVGIEAICDLEARARKIRMLLGIEIQPERDRVAFLTVPTAFPEQETARAQLNPPNGTAKAAGTNPVDEKQVDEEDSGEDEDIPTPWENLSLTAFEEINPWQ